MKARILAFSIVLVGCGGDVFTGGDSGTDSGGNDAGLGSCPSSPPAAGSACVSTKGGPKCEYGSNPDPNCNQTFVCTSNVWVDQTSGTICAPQSLCPATYASVPNGQTCTTNQLSCAYAEGECICTTSVGGLATTTPQWDCFPKQQGCPSPRPDIGSACSTPDQSCDYGACSGGVAMQCTDGAWQQTFTVCPD
jgi:hypothetical protein